MYRLHRPLKKGLKCTQASFYLELKRIGLGIEIDDWGIFIIADNCWVFPRTEGFVMFASFTVLNIVSRINKTQELILETSFILFIAVIIGTVMHLASGKNILWLDFPVVQLIFLWHKQVYCGHTLNDHNS